MKKINNNTFYDDDNDCFTWNDFIKALLVLVFLSAVVLTGTAMIIYALFG